MRLLATALPGFNTRQQDGITLMHRLIARPIWQTLFLILVDVFLNDRTDDMANPGVVLILQVCQ
jgi:hypothetical protein